MAEVLGGMAIMARNKSTDAFLLRLLDQQIKHLFVRVGHNRNNNHL